MRGPRTSNENLPQRRTGRRENAEQVLRVLCVSAVRGFAMNWEVVIGLETHAQLSTASKIFSGAATKFGAAPNVQACAVDIALPGVLPVLNRAVVEKAVRFGLAVGASINARS